MSITLDSNHKKKSSKILLPKKIQAVFFDFDGVFTDNTVIIREDGMESVICNRSDGFGLAAIKKQGIASFVISTETNSVVQKRCEKIGIPCFQAISDKKEFLSNWLKEKKISPDNVVYLGNDVNDNDCIQFVGCGIAVADAHKETKTVAKFILKNKGGHGAVRELCDMILSRKFGGNNEK